MAIGNGLVSTFSPTTSVAKWVVYQIIVGAGRGAGLQMVSSYFDIGKLRNRTH
jgi:hypothetical protein